MNQEAAPIPPSGDEAEFHALADLCERLHRFGHECNAPWLDGVLCMVQCWPRPRSLQKVVELAFDDGFDRAYPEPQEREKAEQVLQQRLNTLAMQLDPSVLMADPQALVLEPFFDDWQPQEQEQAYAEQERLRELSRQAGKQSDESDPEVAIEQGALWAEGALEALSHFLQTEEDVGGNAALVSEVLIQVEQVLNVLTLKPGSTAYKRALHEAGWEKQPPSRDQMLSLAVALLQDMRVSLLHEALKPEQRLEGPKIGRNDPCHCGSGKKFKKCHGV